MDAPKPPEITQDRIQHGIAAIRVRGEVDLATVGELEATVARAVEQRLVPMLIDDIKPPLGFRREQAARMF